MNPSAPTNPSLLSARSRAPSRTAAVSQQVRLSLSSDFEPRLSQQALSLSFHCRFPVGFGDFSYVFVQFWVAADFRISGYLLRFVRFWVAAEFTHIVSSLHFSPSHSFPLYFPLSVSVFPLYTSRIYFYRAINTYPLLALRFCCFHEQTSLTFVMLCRFSPPFLFNFFRFLFYLHWMVFL
ncbi:hypothetical protein I3760_15G106300 [Carya illinoinensis]|nr:hypothetical protein I3760_15G106300 [Carya illinoinensis]